MLPRLTLLLLLLFPSARTSWAFVELKPQTRDAFDRYVKLSEERMEKDLQAGRHLLEGKSSRQEIQTHPLRTLEQGKELEIPEGQVQHWFGAMFIPHATLAQVREVMQDYANYKNRYKPEVIESKLLSQKGSVCMNE